MPTKSKIQGDRESRLMRVARTWGPWKSPPSVIWIRKIKEAATLHERDLSMLLVRNTRLIAPFPMEALLSCIGVHHKVDIPLGSGAAPLTEAPNPAQAAPGTVLSHSLSTWTGRTSSGTTIMQDRGDGCVSIASISSMLPRILITFPLAGLGAWRFSHPGEEIAYSSRSTTQEW